MRLPPGPSALPSRGALRSLSALAMSLFLTVTAPEARADTRFWRDGAAPLSADVLSVRVARGDEPIFSDASPLSPKRGAAAIGALLPVFGAQLGPGCRGRWLLVAAHAFICEEGVELSTERAPPLDAAPEALPAGLPYQYHFVSPDGSFGYRHLETAEEGVPDAQFQPGFGIAVTRVQHKPGADPFGLTSRGLWIPLRDLYPVPLRDLDFQGTSEIEAVAWVTAEGAPVFTRPGLRRAGHALERLTALRVLEEQRRDRALYYRVGEQAWVRATDVRRPIVSEPPPGVHSAERWIDVDLGRQTLVAYVGRRPIFATLVSTGRGAKGSDSATPAGTFRLWVKLRTSDMDNLENVEAIENYAIEAVPWVMFFQRGYGLHGTFWHRRFGSVRSHGCVNLAPRDAERLFAWTSPRLLPGWSAAFPNRHEPGTVVRVRS